MGYLGDRSWANPTWIYSGSMLLCGLSTAIVPLLPGSPWLEVAAGLFGLSIAANYSLVSAILVELISLERFVNAYGLLLLFQGVANLIGPPLAGCISDSTGNKNITNYVVYLLVVFIWRKRRKKEGNYQVMIQFSVENRFVRLIILHRWHHHHLLGSYTGNASGLPACQVAYVGS